MKRVIVLIVALCALSWMASDAAAQYRGWSGPRGYATRPYSPYGSYYRPYGTYYRPYTSYYPGYQSYYSSPGYAYYPGYSYYPGYTYSYPSYGYYPGYAYPGYASPGITLRYGW